MVQLEVAAFWLRQGDAEQLLQHWGVALELRAALRKELFPLLLRLAEDPRTRPAFKPLIKRAPSWWEGFFHYACANATTWETLDALYQMPRQGQARPTVNEQRDFLTRLQQDGAWVEAYFTWLNSLSAEQLSALANIYNGDFELPLSNYGFGWRHPKIRGILVETAKTYGTTGNKALHVGRGPGRELKSRGN